MAPRRPAPGSTPDHPLYIRSVQPPVQLTDPAHMNAHGTIPPNPGAVPGPPPVTPPNQAAAPQAPPVNVAPPQPQAVPATPAVPPQQPAFYLLPGYYYGNPPPAEPNTNTTKWLGWALLGFAVFVVVMSLLFIKPWWLTTTTTTVTTTAPAAATSVVTQAGTTVTTAPAGNVVVVNPPAPAPAPAPAPINNHYYLLMTPAPKPEPLCEWQYFRKYGHGYYREWVCT